MYVVFDMNDFVLRKYTVSTHSNTGTHPVAVHKTLSILTTWVFTTQLPLANEKRLVCLSEIFTLVRILLTTQHVKKAIERSTWLNVAVLEFIKRGANHLDISLNNFKGEEDADANNYSHLVEDFCSILPSGRSIRQWTLATRQWFGTCV